MAQKIGLPERFEQAWRIWNDALVDLDDADFESSIYPHWNLKDIVGHVYSYMDLMLRHVESYRKRKKLASPRSPSYSYFNRREAERLHRVSAVQLRADMAITFEKLSAILPSLSDEDLKKSFPSQWWNSKGHTTLRGLLREEASHIIIHAGDIRKWKERRNNGRKGKGDR